jgi:putative FmdB family regulatory protein
MPTYEYKCLECGGRFEAFQSMTDEPLATCEQCGGKLKRLIGTGAGIIFKGSGFYSTDYRSSSYQASAKQDSTSASVSSTGDSKSGSETTASAKTEASSK